MNRWSLETVTPATDPPVVLEMVKAQLRIEDTVTDEDAMLFGLMRSAGSLAADYMGRSLMTQTLRMSMDAVPEEDWQPGWRQGIRQPKLGRVIELPKPPLQSVSSVVTYDDDDNATTFAASNYYVDTKRAPGRIILRSGSVWPSSADRVGNAIEITFVAGYGSTIGDIPEPIRQAILLLVSHLYENRELAMMNTTINTIPLMPISVTSLLNPYRILRIGRFN